MRRVLYGTVFEEAADPLSRRRRYQAFCLRQNLDPGRIHSAQVVIKSWGPREACFAGHCTGTPEEVAQCEGSYTGQYLKKILK